MNIEKKIKEKFLYKNYIIIKIIYLFFNRYFTLFKNFKRSYSQGSMDLILCDIFKDKKKGVYVDVGCQHPIKNNNTFLLYKKGWKGINIDLDEFNIELFKYNRPNDTNICKAISNKKEMADLFFYHQKSPINTLDNKISELQKAKVKEVKKIETETLSNILNSTLFNEIDLLTIDVEGYELKVLNGFDFEKFQPKIIVVEFLDTTAKKWEIVYNNIYNVINSDLFKFLSSKQYKLVNWVNGDLVFSLNKS